MDPIFSQINSSNKALQLLLSLSALAIIASQYSSLLSYLSSIRILSFSATDRHYIFLICNGIMLLVIKTSGFLASPDTPVNEFYRDSHVVRHHVHSHHQSDIIRENTHLNNNVAYNQFLESNNTKHIRPQIDDLPEADAETNAEVEETTIGITELDQAAECLISTAEEVTSDLLDIVDEQQEHEEHGEQEDEEDEEEQIMLWSTEELNKKCDDFIRKMRYGIKYEAPLVMV